MASVALMSPPNQKEPDVLARASLLPKRKPLVPGIATRARFVKPRPNVTVSASNTSKESVPPPSENAKVADDVPSLPIEAKSEILQRPAIPKRAAAIPVPSRARFQRAKPNIGSLMNKSAKDVQLSEKKCVPMSENTKTQEASDAKLDVPDLSKTESTSEERYNNHCKSAPVARSPQKFLHEGANCSDAGLGNTKLSLNVEKVVIIAYSAAESPKSPQPTIDLDSVRGNYQEFSSIRTIPEDNTLESGTERSSHSDVPVREHATEISSPHDTEMLLTSPRATFGVISEKESPSTSAVMNKNTEYPTLKSILNSPRKRTATKKVHERRKRVANLSDTPSRSEMTMVDLIYWNPSSSPMKEDKVDPAVEELLHAAAAPSEPPIEEPEDSNIGPKVIINDNGEIILDESSLFVRRKDYVDHSVAAVIVNDNTTYSSFRNRTFKTWSKRETAKFYKALSLVGTDFALMENIFKEDGQVTRTRRELKLKFKREEKSNPKFVHTAIYELQTYDIDILDEDHNIELLDESELIDDAPKQAKRAATSGTKTPGKRGRKKKSELSEATINENTSESISEVGEESREATTGLSLNEDLQRIENGTEFNSKPATSRPGRARKAKILSDYVTDVDDLSDTNDNEEETLPIKKRKRIQVLPEEDDAITEAIDNNGSIIDDHQTFQEKITNAEDDYPFIAEETDDNGKSGAVPIKDLRTLQKLPKINEENNEINSSLSDLMPETSRSGRKIKAKKMSDFITDPDTLNESDDGMIPVEKMQDHDEGNNVCEENDEGNVLCEENILCEENAENLNVVESVSQLCNSSQLEGEFSIIPSAETDGEYPGEQNIICTLDVENPNGNDLVIDSSDVMDQNNSELISTTETISSSTEAQSTAISSDQPMIDNLLELPDSETCNDANGNNILTDPAINEVVVTSDQMPRRTRRKILPNVIKGSKRPPIQRIQKKPPLPTPPRRTSFISFTPVEEAPPEVNFEPPTKTYSKQSYSKLIKMEEPGDMPEYLETVQKSPMSISRKRSISGPAKSPCTPEMNIARTNSMCISNRSPLTNTPLNVFSFNSDSKPIVPQSSLELPLNTSVDPKTINMNPENITDSPPVVFLTRTPNNSNMLHLFLYQKS